MRRFNDESHAEKDDVEVPRVSRNAMKRGVMGKYYRSVLAASNVVRISPDLTEAFPNVASGNEALREILRFRKALTRIAPSRTKRRKTA